MAIELFDLVKVMFTNPKKYTELKNVDKAKHYFMIQRFMSIQHPSTAQQLNRVGINGWAVVDLWQLVASRFNRVPVWIYTKTKKVATEKTWKPDPEISKIWMKRTGLGERDLKDAIKYNPEEMKRLFSSLEKQLKTHD